MYFFASCLMTYLLSSVVAITLTVHNIYFLAKLQETRQLESVEGHALLMATDTHSEATVRKRLLFRLV